jgi:hypothetical protein
VAALEAVVSLDLDPVLVLLVILTAVMGIVTLVLARRRR